MLKKSVSVLAFFIGGLLPMHLYAQEASGVKEGAQNKAKDFKNEKVERGWFFFEDPPKPVEKKASEPPKEVKDYETKEEPPPEEKCKKKDTWTMDCGFIDPGPDFSFQEKQRDELMKRMVMSKNSPKSVEELQKYLKWMTERSIDVSEIWQYNIIQNPEYDPRVTRPVSGLGLRLASEVSTTNEKNLFEFLKKEGAFYVYFSKQSCHYCHYMEGPLLNLQQETQLPIKNAALDDKCMPYLKNECLIWPQTEGPAKALQVTVVPTLFLYAPPNTWIRVGTGFTTTDLLKSRTYQFFTAYKTALLKGIKSDSDNKLQPAVSFNTEDEPAGSVKTGIEKNPKITGPTEADVAKLLGKQ